MSTEPRGGRRAATRAVSSLVVAGSAWASAGAADVDFRPAMSFGVYHDGNVAVIGDATDRGDEVGTLAVDLAVTRKTPTSGLTFSFNPSYVAYREHNDLSYFGVSTRLSYNYSGSRQATYAFDVNLSQTERQGVDLSSPSDATTFVPRSKQTHGDVRGRGEHQARRSIVDWEVRCAVEKYATPGSSGGQPSSTLENSTSVGALASWRYAVSEKSSVGLGLDVSSLAYETIATTYVESLGLVGAYAFDRRTSMSYTASAARVGSGGTRTLAAGEVTISSNLTEVSSISAGVRRAVSPGSGLGGSSVDEGGYLAYKHEARRQGLSGSVVAGYWKRDATFPDSTTTTPGPSPIAPSTTTLSTAERLQWNFNRFLALEIGHSYSDQSSSDAQVLVTRYNSYGFNLHWSILGRAEARR